MNRRTPLSFALTAVSVMALSLSQTACSFLFESSPEDMAEEYLELVQDGDYSEVLEFVNDSVDLDEASNVYLDEDIRFSDWEFDVLGEDDDVRGDHTSVDYKIEAHDGEYTIGTFDFVESEGDWELVNPLAKVDVAGGVLRYGDVNGVYTDEQEFWLLPGVYSMYNDPSEYIQINNHDTSIATRSSLNNQTNEEYPSQAIDVNYSISDDIIELVEDQADFSFDECQSLTDPGTPECPIVPDPWGYDEVILESGVLEYDEIDELSWNNIEPPTFDVEPSTVIRMQIDDPGTATLTITDVDGTEYESDCRMSTFKGDSVFNAADELTFDHLAFWAVCDQNLSPATPPDETCVGKGQSEASGQCGQYCSSASEYGDRMCQLVQPSSSNRVRAVLQREIRFDIRNSPSA